MEKKTAKIRRVLLEKAIAATKRTCTDYCDRESLSKAAGDQLDAEMQIMQECGISSWALNSLLYSLFCSRQPLKENAAAEDVVNVLRALGWDAQLVEGVEEKCEMPESCF